MRALLAAIVLLHFVAEDAVAANATPDEIAACKPDAIRLCAPDIDKWFSALRVIACFEHNRSRIGPRCDAVLKAHGL